jgi:amino acid adenylation domain-containing protein
MLVFGRGHTLMHLFDEQVRRSPDATALIGDGRAVTYREFAAQVDARAEALRRAGVQTGGLVGVHLDRSVELVVSIYAVLRVGAAYLPLDPDYPAERLAFMVADAAADVVISDEAHARGLPAATPLVLVGEEEGLDRADARGGRDLTTAGPDDLAYVIYTSGSTGRPKGVMISHAAIVNRIVWMQDEYCLGPDDRVLHKTPFSFDVSVWELFWPLLFGATMVLAQPGGHRDTGYLADLIVREGVTTLHFVPSMLRIFLEDPAAARCTGLRRVFCSGEALTTALQDRFYQVLDVPLHNLYGPTEAAVDVTYWACQPGGDLATVPIGYPVANTTIYLLDEDGAEVAQGSVGRLYIGGVQVARGYLNRPELTAERFLPDPFADRPGARMYDTGDLARRLPDGAIEFLGRADNQVKLRGFRIELGEVEATLDAHPGVAQSAVLLSESGDDPSLIAFWVPAHPAAPPADADLRAHLGRSLPAYMVPARFLVLDELPLGPSGKVDRSALSAGMAAQPKTGASSDRPAGARSDGGSLEDYLAGVWAEVLETDEVDREVGFFDLGGTSLQAARLTNRVQRDLDEQVFVIALFDSPTVSRYADFLRRAYPEAVERLCGEPARGGGSVDRADPPVEVTDDLLARFAALVPIVGPPGAGAPGLNGPALFLLSPPRSGTTLLRVMLAGNPSIFAGSELQLLGFGTMRERALAYDGRFSLWLDGAVRAVMDLAGLSPDAARAVIDASVAADDTTLAFFGRLQELAAPRIVLDKSPSYALDPGILERIEKEFDQPRYLHLVRHPVPMIRSFERHHLDQALYLHEHDLGATELGELVWTRSHQVISDFLDGVPAERHHRVSYEDLVTAPRETMVALCDALGLTFVEEMLHPYDELDAKMVNGIYPESRPMGDTRFLEHGRVRPELADAWREDAGLRRLGAPTRELMARLGYGEQASAAGSTDGPVEPGRLGGRSTLAAQRRRRQSDEFRGV